MFAAIFSSELVDENIEYEYMTEINVHQFYVLGLNMD